MSNSYRIHQYASAEILAVVTAGQIDCRTATDVTRNAHDTVVGKVQLYTLFWRKQGDELISRNKSESEKDRIELADEEFWHRDWPHSCCQRGFVVSKVISVTSNDLPWDINCIYKEPRNFQPPGSKY